MVHHTTFPTFAAWLTARTEVRGVASRLATSVGVGPSSIARMRSGEFKPSNELLSKLVRELGCDAEDAQVAYSLCGIDLAPVMGEPSTDSPAESP